jgi:hypothetical protein
LISAPLPIESLNNEYVDDPVYKQKVDDISTKYK